MINLPLYAIAIGAAAITDFLIRSNKESKNKLTIADKNANKVTSTKEVVKTDEEIIPNPPVNDETVIDPPTQELDP